MDHSEREQIEELKEKCREYEKKMANISVINRWRIGEYLHDNLAQNLNYAKISVSLLKRDIPEQYSELIDRCNEVLVLLDEGIRDVRNLSHDVIPIEIGKEGVDTAFNLLKEQVEKRHKVTCEVETGEIPNTTNRREITSNLYLIAQEATKNAIIHGKAGKIKIAIFEHNDQLYLHVKDDGKGFDPSIKGGVGLDIMKYRAEEIGGTFRIRPAKGSEIYSTYVTCTIPLQILADK